MEDGISAFFKGLLPKLSQTVLSNAFGVMFYEEIFLFLERIADNSHIFARYFSLYRYQFMISMLFLMSFTYISKKRDILNQEDEKEDVKCSQRQKINW